MSDWAPGPEKRRIGHHDWRRRGRAHGAAGKERVGGRQWRRVAGAPEMSGQGERDDVREGLREGSILEEYRKRKKPIRMETNGRDGLEGMPEMISL